MSDIGECLGVSEEVVARGLSPMRAAGCGGTVSADATAGAAGCTRRTLRRGGVRVGRDPAGGHRMSPEGTRGFLPGDTG